MGVAKKKENNRDDFSPLTKKTLAERVTYICSDPNCQCRTVGPNTDKDKSTRIGVAAHITAAAPGGPRYDPSLSSEERSSIENGIWLCESCAKRIDSDEKKYTTELLHQWKRNAELEAEKSLGRSPLLQHFSPQGNLLNSALISQQEHLVKSILESKEKELEEQRKVFREGKTQEPKTWIAHIRNNVAEWNVLTPEIKAKIMRFQASLEFNDGKSIQSVKSLLKEAKATWDKIDITPISAIVEFQENGADSALNILENSENTNALNVKAAIYLETGQNKKCEETLIKIDKINEEEEKPEQKGDTCRLKSLLSITKQDISNALKYIEEAFSYDGNNEIIRYTAGVVYYYSSYPEYLLPERIESWPEPPVLSSVKSCKQSIDGLNKAYGYFENLITDSNDLTTKRYNLKMWKLACLSNNLNKQEEASAYCSDILENSCTYLPAISWAIARSYDFNIEKSIEELKTCISSDKPEIHQILALVICLSHNNQPDEALKVLNKHRSVFLRCRVEELWIFWNAQLHIKIGNTQRALKEINQSCFKSKFIDLKSIILRKEAVENNNWRALYEHLENAYETTNNPIYLFDICWQKAGQNEWPYIAERVEILVDALQNYESFRLGAIALYNSKRYNECLKLLDNKVHLCLNSQLPTELVRIRAQANAELGRITDAFNDAENAVKTDPSPENIIVLAQLCVRIGDLPRLNLIARDILKNDNISSRDLLGLSEIVMLRDTNLAIKLWKKADSIGIEDGQVSQAVGISYQLGIENLSIDLFRRMHHLANDSKYNIWTPSFDELKSFIQENKEHSSKLNKMYLEAQAPVHSIIAQANRLSFSWLYHQLPQENIQIKQQLSKYPLYTCYGGRPSIEVSKDSNLVMDITSILIAEHLGILDNIAELFESITVSMELTQVLIKTQEPLLHINPSKLPLQTKIVSLVDSNKIKTFSVSDIQINYSKEYIEELGEYWLTFYTLAENNDGFYMDFLPVKKAGTIEEATILPQDSWRLIDCNSLLKSLNENGLLTDKEHNEAIKKMGSAGFSCENSNTPPLGSKIFCSSIILECILQSEVMEIICDNFQICIIAEEHQKLIAELKEKEQLSKTKEWLDCLIDKINLWLKEKKFNQLPAYDDRDEKLKKDIGSNIYLKCLLSIMTYNANEKDIICIDDRWCNSFIRRDNAPIVTILDLMTVLINNNYMTRDGFYAKLNILRKSNVCYLPLDAEEILLYLTQAIIQNGVLIETNDLRTVKTYIANCLYYKDNLQLPPLPEQSPAKLGELPFIISMTRNTTQALVRIWKNENISIEKCYACSEWLFRSMYHFGMQFINNPNADSELNLVSSNLAALITLATEFKPDAHERKKKYLRWIYSTIIKPIITSTPELHPLFITYIKELLLSAIQNQEGIYSDEKIFYYLIQNFYEDLPVSIKKELTSDDKFMNAIGYARLDRVEIDNLLFSKKKFWPALKEVVNGKQVKISTYDAEHEITLKPYKDKGLYGLQFKHPESGKINIVVEDVFGALLKTKSMCFNYLKEHRFWFDCDNLKLTSLMANIYISGPEKALDLISECRKSSYTVFYRRLFSRIDSDQNVNVKEMIPPHINGLIQHLRLESINSSLKDNMLDNIAEKLVSEEGIHVAFERLSGLPIIIPQSIVKRIISLSSKQQNELIHKLLEYAGTPVSNIHFAFILALLAKDNNSYDRLLGRHLNYIMSEKCKEEFHFFHKLLMWIEGELNIMPHYAELNPGCRLMVLWEHAHRIHNLLKAVGIDLSSFSDCISHTPAKIPRELFNRNFQYWHDISNPRQTSYKQFFVAGLSYAMENMSNKSHIDFITKKWRELIFPYTEQPQMPDFDLISDPSLSFNHINSFLWHDIGERLSKYFDQGEVRNLSHAELYKSAKGALLTLNTDSKDIHSWLVLSSVSRGLPIYKDLREDVEKLLLKTSICKLIETDKIIGEHALHFITTQLLSIENKDICLYYEKEITKLIKLCKKTQDDVKENGQYRIPLAAIELALNLSIAYGRVENSSSESKFTQLIENSFVTWAEILPSLGETINHMYYELPISSSKAFESLILKLCKRQSKSVARAGLKVRHPGQ